MGERRVKIAGVLVAAGLALGAGAQDVPANGRVFEVASVRVADGKGPSQLATAEGTQVTERDISMTLLLQLAYGVELDQIQGPEWMASSMYDVVAKLPDGVSLTREQMMVPLQQLLANRFNLQVHREVREKPGYALVVAKDGPKLKPAKEGASKMGSITFESVRVQSATMKTLAAYMALLVHQPVVDKTGVDGDYEIKLNYAPEGTKDSTLPSVFTAVQEQLGLKLEPQKVPVNMVVVDKVEKIPTEN
jgi:uncharacterized protein (TIGR03435 family)